MQKQDPCRTRCRSAARLRLRHIAAPGLLALLTCGTPARAEWLFDGAASVDYDSNLGRASAPADMRAGWSASAAGAAKSFFAPGAYDSVTLGVDAGGQVHGRYHGLDNAWAGASAVYRHKAGIGFAAPWVAVEAQAAYYGYDVGVRTGARFLLRAELGKRFSETFDARVGVFFDRRTSPFDEPAVPGISGNVFDLRGGGADVGASWALTDALVLSASLAARRGDVVSTSSRSLPIFLASTAIAEDPTFGDELYDYRLRGTTRTAALTASWALGDRSSLSIGYTGEWTSAAQGLDYHSDFASVTFLYRY